jgi:putative hydrolase of the HAD superfamily
VRVLKKRFGYVRISSKDQNEARQIKNMLNAGVNERDIYIDKQSGKNFDRPQYQALKDPSRLREGDTIVFDSITRMGRSMNMSILKLGRVHLKVIKAALFDLDGTLLNRDESVKMFIDRQYDRLNKLVGHIPKEKYVTRFIELDNRGYVWKDKVYQQLVDEFNIAEITWEELLQDYIIEFRNSCVPFPNLTRMLEELKNNNLILGMITNGYGQFQMDNIKAMGIDKYFDAILVSEWEGIKKPDPQIFIRALEKLNISPNESIFMGDHPENDVKAAQNVGMKGIWKRDFQWNNVEADSIVDDLVEIPLIIEKLNKQNIEFC